MAYAAGNSARGAVRGCGARFDYFQIEITEGIQPPLQPLDVRIDLRVDRDSVGERHRTEEGDDRQEDLIRDQRKRDAGDTEQNTDDIRPDRPPVVDGKLFVELIPFPRWRTCRRASLPL